MPESTLSSPVNTIMRNKNRVLNHLPLARKKNEIAYKLGLCESDPDWEETRTLLTALKSDETDVGNLVDKIRLRKGLSAESIRADLLFCYQTGLLEFHATDVCDLNCIECQYRQKQNATIPFSSVDDYFKYLNPRAVTVTGGGEPNRYISEGKNLNDLILLIHDRCPQIQMGLINNNTHIPQGGWYNLLSWQRTSVDAHDADTYEKIKGKDKYSDCIDNVYRLLDSEIPYVGIGFLYRSENISGMEHFLADWYKRWQGMDATQRYKFNIQFRPIQQAIETIGIQDPYKGLERQVSAMIASIMDRARADAGFDGFLRNRTNFYSIDSNDGSFFLHTREPFTKCYNALLHRVLRADGNEYPDFLLCNMPEMSLGNILTANNADDERIRIALNTFYFHHKLSGQYCNDQNCSQCWVSNLIEQHWDVDLEGMGIPENYFF